MKICPRQSVRSEFSRGALLGRGRSFQWLATLGLVWFGVAGSSFVPAVSYADEADAIAVDVKCRKLVCDFAVSLRHADEGWDHYADAWEVLSEERELLAKRVLRHPHVKEQPFTRSLSGVALPAGTKMVIVRGHDKVHGYGGAELRVEIPGEGGGAGKAKGPAISSD